MDSLSKQYKLQAKIINWEDQLSDPSCIEELAALINPEQRELAMKTAVMVASASRQQQDDEFICEQEREILSRLATGLELSPDQLQTIESAAAEEIKEHPNLWQVLFSLFGNRFDFPVLG